MRFFRLVNGSVEIGPLIEEVEAQPSAWTASIVRQQKNPAHRHTQSILLRTAVHRPDVAGVDNQQSVERPIAHRFPRAMAFMDGFAADMRAELGRAMIVRLKPGCAVSPHVDAGAYYRIRDRYHLVLSSPSGSLLRSGDEEVRMRPGELWWFDNKQLHSAANEAADWRVHCIFDLLPERCARLAAEP